MAWLDDTYAGLEAMKSGVAAPSDPATDIMQVVSDKLAARSRVSEPKDRITRILNKGSEFNAEQHFSDLVKAFYAARASSSYGAIRAGRPAKSIGELMNGLRAKRIEQAESQARIEIADEKNDIDRERLMGNMVAEQLRAAALKEYRDKQVDISQQNVDAAVERNQNRAQYENEMLKIRRVEATAKLKRESRLAAAGDKPTQREIKIRDYMATFPQLTRAQAIEYADEKWKLTLDTVTGNRAFVNEITGDVRPVGRQTSLPRVEQVEVQSQILRSNQVVRSLDAAEKLLQHGIGAKAWLKEWQARTLGQEWLPDAEIDLPLIGKVGIGKNAVDDAVIRARTRLRLLREDLIQALSKTRRVPLGEQERLINLIPKDGVFESAEAARLAFAEIRNKLIGVQREGAMLLGQPIPASASPSEMTDEELLKTLGVTND